MVVQGHPRSNKILVERPGWVALEEMDILARLGTIFHPGLHPLFESAGYAGGYAAFRRMRARGGDVLSEERRWIVIAAAAVGALLGSRVLGLLEQAPTRGLRWQDFLLPGGKTIVGGLLGGWLAVELVKLVMGVRSRTGDLFAVPLCVGIAIGRVGCFSRDWQTIRMAQRRLCPGV